LRVAYIGRDEDIRLVVISESIGHTCKELYGFSPHPIAPLFPAVHFLSVRSRGAVTVTSGRASKSDKVPGCRGMGWGIGVVVGMLGLWGVYGLGMDPEYVNK
jgi:hypothetical protein